MSYFWIYRPTLGNCVSSAGRSSPRLCPGSLLHAGAAFLVGTSRWALRRRNVRQQSRSFACWNPRLRRGMLTKFGVRQVLEPEEKKPSSVSSRFDLIPIYGVGEVLTAPRQRADKYIFPYKWKSHLRIDEVHRHLDAPKK
jgi:hypothetical protein